MIFTLEALQAKHGDCLLLHYGDRDRPQRIVIDGGPAGVFRAALEPRLEELRGGDDSLRLRMLMISHIDDDHIHGVLDLMRELKDDDRRERPLRYRFRTLWHNSFDDLVGEKSDELLESATASLGGAAALAGEIEPRLPVGHQATLVLAGVRQGRQLRLDAESLGITPNQVEAETGRLITARGGSPRVRLGDGLTFRVLGPLAHRVEDLQQTWDEYLEEEGLARRPDAEVAEFLDTSVANLASLMVLAELDGKTMLLTGDGRGDDLLEALEAADPPLLDADGRLHVDLLKLPHHGSDRNVAPEFFRRVHADHYVVSGDGRHHNPEIETFRMLFDARGTDTTPYTLHLTYPVEDLEVSSREEFPRRELQDLFDAKAAEGHPFTVSAPEPGLDGTGRVTVALLD